MTIARSRAAGTCCAGLTLAWVAGSGCRFDARSCTEVGCAGGATVVLQSPTGAWTAGTYELALVIDGNPASCALQLPAAPSPTSILAASCTSQISLDLQAETQCHALPSDGSAVGEGCTPVPGHFFQTLSLPGTPARVELTLSRDSQVLLETTVNLAYQDFYPNGPECGGSCQEASATVSIGADVGDGGVDSGLAD
jgi:hypothetical protein